MDYSKFIKKISTEGLTPKAIEEYCTMLVIMEFQSGNPNHELVLAAIQTKLDADKVQQIQQTPNKSNSHSIKGGFHM